MIQKFLLCDNHHNYKNINSGLSIHLIGIESCPAYGGGLFAVAPLTPVT